MKTAKSLREYNVLFTSGPHRRGYDNWPGHTITASLRIRAVAVLMFRKWFGRDPKILWHIDGQTCYAEDRRDNKAEVVQFNWGDGHLLPVRWSPLTAIFAKLN